MFEADKKNSSNIWKEYIAKNVIYPVWPLLQAVGNQRVWDGSCESDVEHVEEKPARRNVLDEVRIYLGEAVKMMMIMMMLEQIMKTWRIHQRLLIVTAKGKCSWLMLYINNCSQKIMQDVQHEPCFCWRSWHSSLLVQPPWRPRSRNKVLYSLFSVVQTYEIYKKTNSNRIILFYEFIVQGRFDPKFSSVLKMERELREDQVQCTWHKECLTFAQYMVHALQSLSWT